MVSPSSLWRESPGSASGQWGCMSSVRFTLRLSYAAGATPGTAQAAGAGLQDAKAANTRRAYEAAWQRFQEWTDAVGHRSLPAAPHVVALHLGRLAATGRAQATIELARAAMELARAAISHAHAAAGIAKADNPPGRRLRRSRTKGDGSTGTWSLATPGARRRARRLSG